MNLLTLDQRLNYIDHLRGFMFILMAVDHALHAYAYTWKRFWFFRDSQGSILFDALYLHNQSIIMPMLFFIFGMFVLTSLKHRGFFGYLQERLIRLGIPYVIGIPLIVPLLAYPKYAYYEEPGIGYFEYWTEIFLGPKLQAGPFWVLHAIFGFSLLLILICYIAPVIYRLFARFFTWAINNPVIGFISVGLGSALILGISDIIWGAPWWIGFGLFSLQASRMFLILFYFIAGSVMIQQGFLQDNKFMTKFANQWPRFLLLYLIFAAAYMYYVVMFEEQAFNEGLRHYVWQNGGWINTFPQLISLMSEYSPPILIRTTLHGFLCLSQALLLLAVFKKFFSTPTYYWTSLARNCYAIFLVHEAIMIWTQYMLVEVEISVYVKFFITALLGISIAWLISDKILLKIPLIARILSPKPNY